MLQSDPEQKIRLPKPGALKRLRQLSAWSCRQMSADESMAQMKRNNTTIHEVQTSHLKSNS